MAAGSTDADGEGFAAVALSGSSIDDVDVLANELLDELLNDCISMSMHVAEIVEVVPNMLRPLSSLPLGS